ncbi:MAG: SynChlorMet cassette radical SAM/SPASM protein ScmE [Actinomycetes bacterium]
MNTPRSVDIDVTGRCNLRCAYCYHFASAADTPDDLPTAVWLRFFAELKRHAVLDVTLSGGEPFIREDLPVLVEGIVAANLRFSILSNGTLVTPELARMLAASGRCDHVQVSLDGGSAAAHDACRGAGSFERALAGLQALRAAGVPVAVRLTIHRGNVHDLEAAARLLLEDLELPSFGANAAGYMGLCRGNAAAVMLTTDERSAAMETLLRLSDRYPGRIGAMAGPLAEARLWAGMVAAAEGGAADGVSGAPRGGRLNGCGVGGAKLAVRADGVVTPCTQLPQIELGHIARDDLGELWRTHPELARLRRRHTIALTEFAECAGCPYIAACTGNCPGAGAVLTGDAYRPSPDACLRRFLEDGGRLPQAAPA